MPVRAFPIHLETKTTPITLRLFEPRDFEPFRAYWSKPDVARYMRWEADNLEEAYGGFSRRIGRRTLDKPGEVIMPAITDRETGAVLGEAMIAWADSEHQQGEVGYALHPDHQGRGYALAAATEMLRIGFDDLGLHRIIGTCDVRNDASAGLLTRLGMRRESHHRETEFLKGEWTDEYVFAMLADEWTAGR